MARLVRGCPTARLQQCAEEHERDPQQVEQPEAAEDDDIADYDMDIDYEGSESEVEQDTHKQREDDPDAAYAKMEMPRNDTLCQRMMPQEMYMGILQVHKT